LAPFVQGGGTPWCRHWSTCRTRRRLTGPHHAEPILAQTGLWANLPPTLAFGLMRPHLRGSAHLLRCGRGTARRVTKANRGCSGRCDAWRRCIGATSKALDSRAALPSRFIGAGLKTPSPGFDCRAATVGRDAIHAPSEPSMETRPTRFDCRAAHVQGLVQCPGRCVHPVDSEAAIVVYCRGARIGARGARTTTRKDTTYASQLD
jgi:hypothetical protein